MKDVLFALLHLTVMAAKLCGPGGVRAVMAENLLLKQQTDRLAPWPPACAEPEAERPAAVRILVAVPPSAADPKHRHRVSALDAAGASSGVGGPKVPSAVLVATMLQKAWAERARRGTRPHDRGAEVAQSSLRLSSHCANRFADVWARHR